MLHASREPHRRNHALALSWRIMGTVSARALANPRKNWEVSLDHLLPTSAARTTSRALPSALGEFWASRFLLVSRSLNGHSAVVCRSWSGRPVSSQRGDKSRVCGLLGSLPQGETVRDHLHPSIVERVELNKVQIADQHVRCNTTSILSTHLCSGALQWVTSRPQHPRPRALRDDAKLVQSAATSAVAGGERVRETEASAQSDAEWL